MPRRSFVLLVLVMFAGLWTPPHATKAQTGCPEGGCKVFLPLVSTYDYATVVVESVEPIRYCGTKLTVTVANVTTEPITKIRIEGTITWDRAYPFRRTLDNVLFPGEAIRYVLFFLDSDVFSCSGDEVGIAEAYISGATVASQYRSVEVTDRTLIFKSLCYGYATYELSGVIQNTGEETLSNVKVFFLYEIYNTAQQYVEVERSSLAPGETASFTLTFGYTEDPGRCIREPSTVAQERYTVRAWGEYIP